MPHINHARLAVYLRRKDMRLLKRAAGEYEVVGITQWLYHGTARRRGGGWLAIDDGGRMRRDPFRTLDACVRFIARAS